MAGLLALGGGAAVGCSAAPPASATPATARQDGAPREPALPPAPSLAAGDLDGCDPTGTWVAEGTPQDTGNCAGPAATVAVELVVRSVGGARWEARRGDGSALALESLRGAGGRCELDVEERTAAVDGAPASLVLFYHLDDGGTGLAVRDEYEPGPGEFRPESGRVRCTEGYTLAVEHRPDLPARFRPR